MVVKWPKYLFGVKYIFLFLKKMWFLGSQQVKNPKILKSIGINIY